MGMDQVYFQPFGLGLGTTNSVLTQLETELTKECWHMVGFLTEIELARVRYQCGSSV